MFPFVAIQCFFMKRLTTISLLTLIFTIFPHQSVKAQESFSRLDNHCEGQLYFRKTVCKEVYQDYTIWYVLQNDTLVGIIVFDDAYSLNVIRSGENSYVIFSKETSQIITQSENGFSTIVPYRETFEYILSAIASVQ